VKKEFQLPLMVVDHSRVHKIHLKSHFGIVIVPCIFVITDVMDSNFGFLVTCMQRPVELCAIMEMSCWQQGNLNKLWTSNL
jgi:hypothetical protein